MKRLIMCAIGVLASVLSLGVSKAQTPAAPAAVDPQIKGLSADVAMDQHPAQILGAMRSSYQPTLGRHLGLQSAAEVDETEVGPPIRMVSVRFDLLRTYDGRSPADALLQDVPLVTRLVRVRGQVQSIMLMSNARGAWEVTQMGNAAQAVAIDQVTALLQQSQGVLAEGLFLVTIRGLGLSFLGHTTSGTVFLTPLFDNPQYGLVAGQPASAEAVLGSLVTAAQRVPIMRTHSRPQ